MYIDDGSGSYIKNAENETIKVNNKAADGSDLAIAEQVKRTDVSFVKVNYETGVEMADIFFKITSSTGEAHYVKQVLRAIIHQPRLQTHSIQTIMTAFSTMIRKMIILM